MTGLSGGRELGRVKGRAEGEGEGRGHRKRDKAEGVEGGMHGPGGSINHNNHLQAGEGCCRRGWDPGSGCLSVNPGSTVY